MSEEDFTFNPACLVRNIVAVVFLIIMIVQISGAMDADNWVELEGDNVDSGDMKIGLYDLSWGDSGATELEDISEDYSDADQYDGVTYWGRFDWAGWLANIWFWLVMIGIGLIALVSLFIGMADDMLEEFEVDQSGYSVVAQWAVVKIGLAVTIAGAVLIGCLGWYIITPDYDDILIGEERDGDNIYLQDSSYLKDAEFVLSDGWYDMMWTMLWAGLYLGVMLIPAEKFESNSGRQQQQFAQQPVGQQQQFAQQPVGQQQQFAQQPVGQQQQFAQQPVGQQPMIQQAPTLHQETKNCQHCGRQNHQTATSCSYCMIPMQ